MFIVTAPPERIFAPLGAKPGSGMTAIAGKNIALLPELRTKEKTAGYKHFAPLGHRDQRHLLHLNLNSRKTKYDQIH